MSLLQERRGRALRVLASVIGVVYLALGVAGFFAANGGFVGRDTTNTVGSFSVGSLPNLGHLALGVLGVLGASSVARARLFGWASFVVLVGVLAYGIPEAATSAEGDLVNINWADIWLYGLTAVLGLVMGLLPLRGPGRGTATTTAEPVRTSGDRVGERRTRDDGTGS